jgi:hypothetical protein
MLFDEHQEPLQLWRMIRPASGYADPAWTYITTISGRIEAISIEEVSVHNQSFNNQLATMLSPLEYATVVLPGDGIVDTMGIQWRTNGYPEIWKWEMPHIAVRVERSQWTVTS